jgi:hypothetical protein
MLHTAFHRWHAPDVHVEMPLADLELPRFSNKMLRYERMPEGLVHEIGLPARRAMTDAYVTVIIFAIF